MTISARSRYVNGVVRTVPPLVPGTTGNLDTSRYTITQRQRGRQRRHVLRHKLPDCRRGLIVQLDIFFTVQQVKVFFTDEACTVPVIFENKHREASQMADVFLKENRPPVAAIFCTESVATCAKFFCSSCGLFYGHVVHSCSHNNV